jgi:hypothetical protein
MSKAFRSVFACLLAACVLFLSIRGANAQTAATGALSGTVTDPQGAAIANATVTISNLDTGQSRTGATGPDGAYRFGLLPPGNYRLQFEASGFRTATIGSAVVNVTETAVLDGRLEVGAQSQEITVQGETEITVQTADATVGTVLAGKTISDLPLTSRNYTNLLGLSAGANTGVFNASTLGRGTQDISVNGSGTGQNNFQMDGVSIVNFAGNGSAVDTGSNSGIGVANPDAIQEFKIQTSMFDAGYGRKPGANVNVVTKSGTNAFHGSAFEFFRNTALNANDFFRNQTQPLPGGIPNNTRQVLNQNQYGGVIGGPVKKDKLFFFASYQESWQKNGIASQGYSVPSLLPIFPGGDRSNTAALKASLGATFCPTGTDGGISSNGKNVGGAVQVACDGSNINPIAINLLQLKNPDGSYYVPSTSSAIVNSAPCSALLTATCTSVSQNSTFSVPALYKEHQGLGNMDYIVNAKNTLSTRYFYSTDPTQVSFNCGASGGSPGNCVPDTGEVTRYGSQLGVMKLTTILTNNVVNEARASIQRNSTNISDLIPFTNNDVNIPSIVPNINQLDQILISGQFTFGTLYSTLVNKYITGWEAADQASWNRGKNTIRFGGEIERQRINWHTPGNSIGALTFNNFQDFLLGLPGCAPGTTGSGPTQCNPGNPGGTNGTTTSNIASSGSFSSVSAPSGVYANFRSPAGNAFIQDDIKLSQRLTINLGLRWEYSSLIYAQNGNLTNVWPSLINTVPVPGTTAATGTLAGYVVPSNYNYSLNPAPTVGGLFQSNHLIGTRNNTPLDDFTPRIGFAWQPTKSDRFVVRGGYGSFYERLGINQYANVYIISSPYQVLLARSGAANYYSSLQQPYPSNATLGWSPRWVNFNAGTSSNLSNYTMSEIYQTPLVQEWNLNLQYEFAPSWVMELGYVGSHGIHQAVGGQLINQAQLASVANPINGISTNTAANASLRVPYLGFAPAGLIEDSTNGSTKFNSLQATLRKQFSHGLTFQAAYTWSKSLATNATLTSNDANNYAQQYGPNTLYHPQRLAINYNYSLPAGHFDGIAGKLTSGWVLSGVTIVQDGTPLTVTDTRGGTVYGFGGAGNELSRAQYCAGMSAANAASTGSVQQRLGGANGGQGWFNKSAFCAIPAIGSDGIATGYGDSSIGIVLGPGQFNWDMSLTKTTKVGGVREDATLQFRTEFFNTFNHPQFSNPAVVDFSKGTFGQITSSSVNPRLIQFALKYAF